MAVVKQSTLVRAGGFLVSEANPNRSRAMITIVAGQNLIAGTVLGTITASGKYAVYNPALSDGTQTPSGILWDKCDATAVDKKAAAIVRQAEVNQNELTWFGGATGGQITAGLAALAAIGIIGRPGI